MPVQYKASDLSPQDRAVVERLFGRALDKSEFIVMNTVSAMAGAWRVVSDDMQDMHARVDDVPTEERDALIEEAIEHVLRHPE